jgi:hypothetical protein
VASAPTGPWTGVSTWFRKAAGNAQTWTAQARSAGSTALGLVRRGSANGEAIRRCGARLDDRLETRDAGAKEFTASKGGHGVV